MLLNFKMNFKQEEGGFLQKNESKLPSQFMINVFESYLQFSNELNLLLSQLWKH